MEGYVGKSVHHERASGSARLQGSVYEVRVLTCPHVCWHTCRPRRARGRALYQSKGRVL